MKTNTPQTKINAQEWVEQANKNRDPFAFDPQYFVMDNQEAEELLAIDPSIEEREIEVDTDKH